MQHKFFFIIDDINQKWEFLTCNCSHGWQCSYWDFGSCVVTIHQCVGCPLFCRYGSGPSIYIAMMCYEAFGRFGPTFAVPELHFWAHWSTKAWNRPVNIIKHMLNLFSKLLKSGLQSVLMDGHTFRKKWKSQDALHVTMHGWFSQPDKPQSKKIIPSYTVFFPSFGMLQPWWLPCNGRYYLTVALTWGKLMFWYNNDKIIFCQGIFWVAGDNVHVGILFHMLWQFSNAFAVLFSADLAVC